ncbi:MAG TPA: dTMP kinase [Anaeromyxobacteraceae bacterium]|nr:dTMP kinase [Anaeromyxobacteraceae bacterium]
MKRRARLARGRFIVVEGLDGAGTTTQSRLLAERLRAAGRKVHVTAEPSAGPVGALARLVLSKRIGGDAKAGAPFDADALALLFAADRLDHVASEIAPLLAEGVDVVSDRYALSSLAYQAITTGDAAWVEAVNARARAPDVTLFLEVSPRTAVSRRFSASSRRELYEVPEFQRKVARSYQRGIARLRALGQRVEVIDGEQDVAAVTDALVASLEQLPR